MFKIQRHQLQIARIGQAKARIKRPGEKTPLVIKEDKINLKASQNKLKEQIKQVQEATRIKPKKILKRIIVTLGR